VLVVNIKGRSGHCASRCYELINNITFTAESRITPARHAGKFRPTALFGGSGLNSVSFSVAVMLGASLGDAVGGLVCLVGLEVGASTQGTPGQILQSSQTK